MGELDAEFARRFQTETWTLFGVGVLAAVLRSIARIRRLGLQGLQLDDYLIVVAVFCYTMLCVALNRVVSGGGSNLMTDEDIAALTPEIHATREAGSKWVFVSEHFMVLTLWTLKSVMLLIYARITDGLSQRRLVNYCAIWVGIGFVASELSLFLICRPLSNYWAVPTPNPQCANYQHYEIIQGVFAITADIFMLLVAIPLLMAVRLPTKQKTILILLFGLGIFVIVAAILTKVYCLVPALISYVYMNWYFREATVAMLVTCLPLTWSLFRDIFPSLLGSWTGGSKGTARPSFPTWPFSKRGSAMPLGNSKSGKDFADPEVQLQSFQKFKGSQLGTQNDDGELHGTTIVGGENSDRTHSRSTQHTEERVAGARFGPDTDTDPLHGDGIRRDVTITVHSDGGDDWDQQSHSPISEGRPHASVSAQRSFDRPRS